MSVLKAVCYTISQHVYGQTNKALSTYISPVTHVNVTLSISPLDITTPHLMNNPLTGLGMATQTHTFTWKRKTYTDIAFIMTDTSNFFGSFLTKFMLSKVLNWTVH